MLKIVCVILLLCVNGCLDRNFDDISKIPLTEDSETYHILDWQRLGFHFKYKKGRNSIPLDIPDNVEMILLDQRYREVDYHHFLRFNKWFENLIFNNGVMAINQNETLDCDNFAMLYKSLFSVSGYASGNTIEFAVASIAVTQINEFGGIPNGGLHMLNLIFTNKGWFVFEPQTGKYIEFEKYSNQKYIRYIIL